METKTCCRCNETKLLSDYYKQGGACKTCTAKRYRELYSAMTPERKAARKQTQTAYRENNRDRFNERAREQNKKPHTQAWRKAYVEKNREVLREKGREYYKNNRNAIVAYQNNWYHEKPEKWLQYYEAYKAKPEKHEAMIARAKKARDDLSLGYVNILLGGDKENKFPVELLEAKRVQIQIGRAIKNMIPANQEPQGV
jgi:hypothetical protein